jgi:hypothetical protein
LGNNETLAESRITIGDIPGAITMHVVVQPPVAKKKTGLFKKFICPFAKAVYGYEYLCPGTGIAY